MTHDLFGAFGFKPNFPCQLVEGCFVLVPCPIVGLKLARADIWVCDDQNARCANSGQWFTPDQWASDPIQAMVMLNAYMEATF